MNKIRRILPFFKNWHTPCKALDIGWMTHPPTKRGMIMTENTTLSNRLFAAFAAVSTTCFLLVVSFAPPAATMTTIVA